MCLPGPITLILVNICESMDSLFTSSSTELECQSSYVILGQIIAHYDKQEELTIVHLHCSHLTIH